MYIAVPKHTCLSSIIDQFEEATARSRPIRAWLTPVRFNGVDQALVHRGAFVIPARAMSACAITTGSPVLSSATGTSDGGGHGWSCLVDLDRTPCVVGVA